MAKDKPAKPTEVPEAPTAAATAPTAPAEDSFDEKVAKAVARAMGPVLGNIMPAMAESIAKAMVTAQMAVKSAQDQSDHAVRLAELRKKAALEEKCHFCRQVVGDGKGRGCGGPWKRNPRTNEFVMEPVLDPITKEALTDGDGKPKMRRVEDPNQFHHKRAVYPRDPMAAEWFMGIIVNGAIYQSQGPNHEIWVPNVNDIDSQLSVYEQNEREQRVGRKHVRANGGSLSGRGGHNTAPVGVGFS